MFDDGPVMVVVDFQLLGTFGLALLFVTLYVTRVRFERSLMGRLIAANGVAWLLVIVGGILYRIGVPDLAQWFFLPLGFGVPVVLCWWIIVLARSRGDQTRLGSIAKSWTAEAWRQAANGRTAEAQQAFRHAKQLSDALDIGGEPSAGLNRRLAE